MLLLGCTSTEFRCSNGQCVSSRFSRCTGFRTCTDGSDERNCSKFLIYFDCFNSSSYIWTLLATICTVSCQSGAFRCNNGMCISSSDRCDGNRDCTDGSDEIGCSKQPNYVVWWMRIHTSVIVFQRLKLLPSCFYYTIFYCTCFVLVTWTLAAPQHPKCHCWLSNCYACTCQNPKLKIQVYLLLQIGADRFV